MPVLATSGLDDDIKIWVPSCEDPPDLSNLKSVCIFIHFNRLAHFVAKGLRRNKHYSTFSILFYLNDCS